MKCTISDDGTTRRKRDDKDDADRTYDKVINGNDVNIDTWVCYSTYLSSNL